MGAAQIIAFETRPPMAGRDGTTLPEQRSMPSLTDAGLTFLTHHIEQKHHARLRRELPRIAALMDQVISEFMAPGIDLIALRDVFQAFRTNLERHLAQEEQVLFPLCRALESESPWRAAREGVTDLILSLKDEHDRTGDLLCAMRRLARNYTEPKHADRTYRDLMRALADLELDTHMHVHKENCLLFPKARTKAAALRAGAWLA